MGIDLHALHAVCESSLHRVVLLLGGHFSAVCNVEGVLPHFYRLSLGLKARIHCHVCVFLPPKWEA